MINTEYIPILVFIVISLLLAFVIYLLSYILIAKQYDIEKISAYECGFDPFEDARNKFDVRFYLIAILFIIFDLEISFLFPWSVVLDKLNVFGFFVMFFFLFVLIIGFLYEWKKGALDWE